MLKFPRSLKKPEPPPAQTGDMRLVREGDLYFVEQFTDRDYDLSCWDRIGPRHAGGRIAGFISEFQADAWVEQHLVVKEHLRTREIKRYPRVVPA